VTKTRNQTDVATAPNRTQTAAHNGSPNRTEGSNHATAHNQRGRGRNVNRALLSKKENA